MIPKNAAVVVAIVLIFFGVLGFVNNPLFGSDGVFPTNRGHSIFFIFSGVLFFVAALLQPEVTRIFIIAFGFLFLLLGLIGLVTSGTSGSGRLLGMHLNTANNLLHIALGVIVLLLGITSRRDEVVISSNDRVVHDDRMFNSGPDRTF